MSVSGKKGRNLTPYYRHEKPLTVEEVKTFPFLAVPQQDIIQEDAELFGVRSEVSQEDGQTIVATYFPYYNQEGKLTGYKRRDWTKDKEEKGHFTVVGVVKVNSKLFGQHICKTNPKGNIYYVEGEGCCIATRRALLNSIKGTQWEKNPLAVPNVVSVNCGAGNAMESTAHNEDFLRSFKKIVCLMDNDHATEMEKARDPNIMKGREATEAIASFLLADNFFVVEFPEGVKDCRQWAKQDPKTFAKKITWELKTYSPEKIVSTKNVSVKDLRKKKKKGIPLRHLKRLQAKTKSPIKGELWTLTAPSGAGKSTITRDIEFDIASYLHYGLKEEYLSEFREEELKRCEDGLIRLSDYETGEKLGIIRLEEGYDESLNSLYAMDMGLDPKKFVEDIEGSISLEDHEAIHEKWKSKDTVYVLDHFGSLGISSLIGKLKQMMAFGCRWFILDHYTMLVSGMRTSNDVKELDIIMTELAAFCQQYGVFILGVSHMKRKNIEPPKDKETGEQLAFFYPVRKEDMRGCLPAETEFLSQHGWKKICDWEIGDKVMQHDDKGCVSFVEPLDYIEKPCDYMTEFKTTKGLHMVLSDEHNIVYATERRKKSFNKITAVEALAIHNNQSTGFRGLIPTTFTSEEKGSLGLTEDELRLQVAVNADGWIRIESTGRCSVRLKKERKIKRLRDLLERVKIPYTIFNLSEGRTEFSFIAPLKSKGISSKWYTLSQKELEIICDEVNWWDCCHKSGRFSSVVKEEADFIQFVYSACGYRSTVTKKKNGWVKMPKNDETGESGYYETKPLYIVSKAKNKFVSFRKAPNADPRTNRVETSDGKKYCFTVPSGMFVARHEGKVFVTGNSAALEQLSWVVILLEPEELPNRSRGRVRLVIAKNRRGKVLGVADTLWQLENGTYVDASDWEVKGDCYIDSEGNTVHCFADNPLPILKEKESNPIPLVDEVLEDEVEVPTAPPPAVIDDEEDEPF